MAKDKIELTVLFRYHYDWVSTTGKAVYLNEYKIMKHTRCGVWIDVYGDKKWVSLTGKKRYAYPTKEQAADSFMHRKLMQISILKGQLKNAKYQLSFINKMINNEAN